MGSSVRLFIGATYFVIDMDLPVIPPLTLIPVQVSKPVTEDLLLRRVMDRRSFARSSRGLYLCLSVWCFSVLIE